MTERARWGFTEGDEIAAGLRTVRRLGGGIRFETYVAIDERRAATVVVKIVRPDRVDDERTLTELRRETDALRRLAHPIIVRAFDAVLDGPRPLLVMEHLEGPTLRGLLRRYGPLPLEQVVPLAVHVASALHYMAGEGVLHLDLKPANLIMGVTPRVIDLSVSRTVEEASHLRVPIGTTQYMAPEQCAPSVAGIVGPPADVWGLGATLYRAVTGKRAFPSGDPEARDPDERYPQLRLDPRPLPPTVARPVADTVLACLRKDPAERPTAAQVMEAVEGILAVLPRRPVLGRKRPRLGAR